jgi:hypothetical protein
LATSMGAGAHRFGGRTRVIRLVACDAHNALARVLAEALVLYHMCMHVQLGAGSPIPGLSASAARASVANATMSVAALHPLPSLSLEACRYSVVPVATVCQHREHDRLGATAAVARPKSSIIMRVGPWASRCRCCRDTCVLCASMLPCFCARRHTPRYSR